MRKLLLLSLTLIPLAFFCLIFGPMFYGLSGYLTGRQLGGYALVYQVGNQRYAYTPNAWLFAIDRFSGDPHLYFNTGDFDGSNYRPCFAADFLALAFNDFSTAKTGDNPYYSGHLQMNSAKYCASRKQYVSATEYRDITDFHDPAGQLIYRYDPESDDNLYIKSFPITGKRSSAHFSLRMLTLSERYIDLTALLATQKIKPQLAFDDNNRVITLSFVRLPQ